MYRAEYAEAIYELDALLSQLSSEERTTALYWKAFCLGWLGKFIEERACLDEALTQGDISDPLKIYLILESAYLQRTEEGPDKAVCEIRSVLNRYAEEFQSLNLLWPYVQAKEYLGCCLSLAGNYPEAIKELEEAISVETLPLARYSIHYWIGDAAHKVGDLDKARDHLERASVEAHSAPKAGVTQYYAARIPYELALIAYKQDRFAEAEHQLEIALSVGTQDPNLSRVMSRLKSLLNSK
jgi:tetratricopeptide (TPR) repeat protein